MENSRIAQITSACKELLGRIPTSQELRAYLSARGDAESLVAQTSEYRVRVSARLDQVHRALLGSGADDARCDAFIRFCADAGAKPHACERSIIQDFVAATPQFLDKYAAVVEEVYRIEVGRAPDLKTKSALALRFKDEAFSPSDLAEVIRADGPAAATVESIEGSGDAVVVHKAVERIGPELEFVERWQRATGRRVDIYEFLRYYGELGSSPSPESLRSLKDAQDRSFARAAKVYRDYLGVDLDFNRFTALHVHEHDLGGFDAKLVAKIVESNEYRARMCEALAASYGKAFDVDVHPDDLEHTFEAVRARGLSLKSDEISAQIAALGEELSAIAGSVGDAYERVLRRAPDALEIRHAVRAYRSSENAADAQRSLEDSLYDEPEYQEVLKSLIKEATGYSSNADVFRVMRRVLAECGGDMKTARDHIGST